MNNEVSSHLDKAINEVRDLFTAAALRIEALKPGEKIPATQLAQELGVERGMTGAQAYPILKILLNSSYPGVKILKGAHGGIMKNKPEQPIEASSNSATTPLANAPADGDDEVVQETVVSQ